MQPQKKNTLNISAKSFLAAILVILALMIATYVLTFFIPAGEYIRIPDENGNPVIDTANGFYAVDGGISFTKWILSPVLVLLAPGSGTILAIIAFLLIVGGVFNSFNECGLMQYMLGKTANKFGHVRYRLMAIIVLLFMVVGAMIGSFEECVPLVPIVVALSVNLGWDPLVGMGMSLLAAGCGFASGVCNPFTVGVAQELAGLPMFSGVWMRLVSFILIYSLLLFFLRKYAQKIERPLEISNATTSFVSDPKQDRALCCFIVILGLGITAILCSGFISALQDYTMVIVAAMFLIAGISSTLLSGMSVKQLGNTFFRGLTSMLPAVLMILMASSIRYTLEEARVLDSILHGAVQLAQTLPKWAVLEFIYLLVLVMNFFIPSGSAKAFMLIPLIIPMAQVFGISSQLCVLAFAFGDGFSNVFYPTNPVLLIALGLSDVSYNKWFKWSGKFQLANLLLTALLLLFGLFVGY